MPATLPSMRPASAFQPSALALHQPLALPLMSRPSPRQPDVKLLWGRAASRCSFPACRRELSIDSNSGPKIIGKQAHIVAYSDNPNAPRSCSSYSKLLRNSCENLILLCGTHHDIVDNDEQTYTIEALRTMKITHENWVNESLQSSFSTVGFQELDSLIQSLLPLPTPQSTAQPDFETIPLKQKMNRNSLTKSIEFRLSLGLSLTSHVENVVSDRSLTDSGFANRIRKLLVQEYSRLFAGGMSGDSLFHSLVEYLTPSGHSFDSEVAALGILTYFFEKCEVFEK